MCTNNRWIYNRYAGKTVLCKCGVCPACQQERADRVSMSIVNHKKNGWCALFIHLTYMNDCVPYIFKNEIKTLSSEGYSFQPIYLRECLSVYRDSDFVKIRDNKGKIIDTKLCLNIKTVLSDGSQNHPYLIYKYPKNYEELSSLVPLRGQSDFNRVGVLWWPDLQNFFKRLRKNVEASPTLANENFSYFACGEYGEHYKRPHFHVLLFVKNSDAVVSKWSDSIVKSWPFALDFITRQKIEVAKHAASYVSTYVNKSSDFPKFLRFNASQRFRERFSHSKGFGRNVDPLLFSFVYQRVISGKPYFIIERITKSGADSVDIPYSKRYIGRYIPFAAKGYSRLSDSERICIAANIFTFYDVLQSDPKRFNYSLVYKRVLGLTQDGCSFDEEQIPYFRDDLSFDIVERSQVYLSKEELDYAQHKSDLCYNHFYVDYALMGLKYVPENKTRLLCYHVPNLRYIYADFVRNYIFGYRSYIWHLHFDKMRSVSDILFSYDNLAWNIKDVSLTKLRDCFINNLFKELKAYDKLSIFDPNLNPDRVSQSAKKSDRFQLKVKHHLINDKLYAEY